MMTPSYSDAVSVCVGFSFEGVSDSWKHLAFRRAACEKVLGSLQEICKAWISFENPKFQNVWDPNLKSN